VNCAFGTVCTVHLVQCELCIWYSVYCAFGTVCTVHLVQCVLCILQNSIMFNQQMCKQFVNPYLLLAALLHVPIPKYLLQGVVHTLQLFICYSSSYATVVHMLQLFTCYSCSHATVVHMLQLFICYSCSYATVVHMLQLFICYSCSYATVTS
jgi:hypothetical protein